MNEIWTVVRIQHGVPSDPIESYTSEKDAKDELAAQAREHNARLGANGFYAGNGRGFQAWIVRGGLDHVRGETRED